VLLALAGTATGAQPHDRSLRNFHNPSNNIRCAINAQRVVCVSLDPKRAVRILAGKKADRRAFLELPAGSVLSYGQTSTIGRFSCGSSSSGMKCRDRRTGHAFQISRLRVLLLPKKQPAVGGTPAPGGGCDPNYSGACVPRYPPDVDCSQIPATNFRVVGVDVHGLDRDGNGIACES
jgi:hypothetical protein